MSFLNLNDVKDDLNQTGTITTLGDAELQRLIDTAESRIVRVVGPVDETEQDEWHNGGAPLVKLMCSPVVAVITVTESYGVYLRPLTEQPLDEGSFSAYGYTIDLDEGVLTRRVAGVAAPFAPGRRNVHVVYTAGWVTPPADIVNASMELVRYLAEPQRGSGRVKGQPSGPAPMGERTGLPLRVEQMIVDYISVGIA